jgi:hypothetical protein
MVDIDAVTKEFNESFEGRLFRAVRDSALDKRKQGALYQDDDVLTAVEVDFAEPQVEGVLKIASDAQVALARRALNLPARKFYEITLKG